MATFREIKMDFLNSIPNFGIDLSLITMQEQREKIIPHSERERTMYLLKYAPLNKCTLMFTGNLDEVKRDLELLHKLEVKQTCPPNFGETGGAHRNFTIPSSERIVKSFLH